MKLRVLLSIILVFTCFLFLNSEAEAKRWNFVSIQYGGGEPSTQNIANHHNIPEGYNSFNATSVSDMVNQINSYMSPSDTIGSLEIRGHGHSGTQSVGGTETTWDKPDMSISVNNMPEWQNTLAPLVGRFTTDGQLSLYGCQVASGEEGAQLLYELQKFLETSVLGAVDTVCAGFQNIYEEYGDISLCPFPSSEPPKAQAATWSFITAILFILAIPIQSIPTLSEWRQIFLTLIMLSLVMGFMRKNHPKAALSNGGSILSVTDSNFLAFNRHVYTSALNWVGVFVVLELAWVAVIFGHVSVLDIIGTLFCAPLVAYMTSFISPQKVYIFTRRTVR